MTRSELLTELSVRLRDTSDQRWTSSEKEECIDSALRDRDVIQFETDTSLTASPEVQVYPLSGIAALSGEVQPRITDVKILSGDVVTDISSMAYNINAGSLFFKDGAPLAGTIYLTYPKKLSASDNIPDEYTELIINLAACTAYEMLLAKGISHFLTNDTSPQEILGSLSYHRQRVDEERSNLSNKDIVEY
jgi:hypothetical protein